MVYIYQCTKRQCSAYKDEVLITKSMGLSNIVEYCEECTHPLQRVFTSVGIKTSDGYKS